VMVRPHLLALYGNSFAAMFLPRVPRDAEDLEPLDAHGIALLCDADFGDDGVRAGVIL
jgi:hypothetical protein